MRNPQYQIQMKKITIFFATVNIAFFCSNSNNAFAQGNAETQSNFKKMRRTEFTKLNGGIQEGYRINYNSEKTNIEGSLARELDKVHSLLQLTASVGTTTNLSQLFTQDVLPTFSVGITHHYLFQKASTWFYDNTFSRNYSAIKNGPSNPSAISTKNNPIDPTEATVFEYKNELRNKINKESNITASTPLYTYKKFTWLSTNIKYNNSKYQFYDNKRLFNNQLYEPIYDAWTAKISISNYRYWNKSDVNWVRRIHWRPNFIYFTAGLQYGLNNNIQQLKKTTVTDILSSTVSGTSTRQTTKSTNSYTGDYNEFHSLTPSFDLLISPIQSCAVNIFGDYNFIKENSIQNFGSIATGIYFYSGESQSKINIGVYHKWTRNNNDDTWVREIGLRTSIPITPL